MQATRPVMGALGGQRKDNSSLLKASADTYHVLGTSLGVQAKVFFENSTLHGVRYIAEKDRPFVEKFMWFACVSIGAVATTIIIISLWEKFQTNPTITGLDTDYHNFDVPFPAITLCPEITTNVTRNKELVKTKGHLKLGMNAVTKMLAGLGSLSYNTITDFGKTNLKTLVEFAADSNLKEETLKAINTCEHMFNTCTFKSKPSNCCDLFYPVFTEVGVCYAFNSRHYEKNIPWIESELPSFNKRYIKETDASWSLEFEVKNNKSEIAIYILNSDEMAGLDIQPQHIWDFTANRISFSIKQTYTTEDTKQLSVRQRHCVFPDEIKLAVDNMYTFTACTRQCRMENSMKACRCVPHWYPALPGYRHCKANEIECLLEYLEPIKAVDHCHCELGCSNTVYEVEKLREVSGNDTATKMTAEFVSWPMVRYKREVLFGWVDLLVSFGGIAGLFLGFSLLSGVEIIYYFTVRAFCMAIRERPELQRIQHEQASKPTPDYDLSLVPYFIAKPQPGSGMRQVAKGFYGPNLNNWSNKVSSQKEVSTIFRPGAKELDVNVIRQPELWKPKVTAIHRPGVWKPKETFVAPIGIEFIN